MVNKDIYEIRNAERLELLKYVRIDGPNEMTVMLEALCDAAEHPDYMTETFKQAVADEILYWLNEYKENTELIEREEEVYNVVKYTEVIWK